MAPMHVGSAHSGAVDVSNAKDRAAKRPRGRPAGSKVECRTAGNGIIWPKGLEERYGISKTTRWLWEQQGKLPPPCLHRWEADGLEARDHRGRRGGS